MQLLPFPVLETERLLLRRLTPEDAADVFLMRSDPEVMRFIPRPIAQSVQDAADLIQLTNDFLEKNEKINWGMESKETRQIIGMIGYVNMKPEHARAEVGYSLRRSCHRKGFMREALLRVMKFGFEQMKLHTLEAIIDAENEASGKLLLSAGFRQEAHFIEDFLFKGAYRNSIHFGMLAHEAIGKGICDAAAVSNETN
jgi:ribosomal-protein-alanine N-acetyltransferase